MLGVDRVVLDRGIEPEPEAIVGAVVEGRLERRPGASPSAAAAPAAPAPAPGALGVAVLVLRLLLVLILRLGVLVLSGGLLLERRLLDLRLDLVAELQIPGVLLLRRELVPAAELAQLRGRNVELVRDPGIRSALADPGANLVEL